MRGPLNRVALLALGMCAVTLAQAGVYVEMVDVHPGTKEKTLVQKIYIQGKYGRLVDVEPAEPGGDKPVETAMVLKDNTLYAVNDTEKSYVVMDKASMEQLGKTLDENVNKIKEQLSKLPPDQRAQMEEMLGKQVPGLLGGEQNWTVDAIDTGQKDTVDGRSCRIWDIKRNGELDEQLCVVAFSALPGKENFQAVFGDFAKAFEELMKTVPTFAGMLNNEFSAQEKINGFPVRSRDYENGKLADTERRMSVWRVETIPASMFEMPAGYQRKTAMEMAGK